MKTWTYPDGYDPHGGYLDRVTFIVYPDNGIIWTPGLEENFIYAWDERVPASNIPELEARPGIEVSTEPGDMYRMFCMNCKRFPTNITAYRRALAYALDKYAVVQASTGGLAFLQDCALPIALGNWTYESQLTQTYYSQNIHTANATLEAAGFRDLDGNGWRDYDCDNSSTFTPGDILDFQFNIELFHTAGHAPSGNAVELAVQGLHLCGIMAEVAPQGYYEMLDMISSSDFWLGCFTFTNVVSPEVLFKLFHNSTSDHHFYFGGWTNATYITYVENLMAARTIEEANHWAWQCQEILWYEQPMVVCYNDVYTHAYRTDIWEGYINRHCRNRIGNGFSLVHIRLKEDAGGPFGCYPTEYKLSLNEGVDTTNYLLSNSEYTAKVFQLVYEGLWTYSPYDWTPQPALAYAWETEPTVASGDIQDGEKYTFHLFENATWHDGTPVTATDVAYSVLLGHKDPYHLENYENIYLIRVNSLHTIELYTNSTGYFEWIRATGFTVFPHHIWSDDTITGGNVSTWVPSVSELVGSGPYVFVDHVPGQYVVLERHTDWHFRIEHPIRILCDQPLLLILYVVIPVGVLVIILQTAILGYLLQRKLRNRKALHSENKSSTKEREE